MVDQPDVNAVETTEEHYRFRFRDRTRFEELADTPQWAQEAVETVSDDATVRMGRLPDSDSLQVESVEAPRKPNLGREDAKNVAEKIVESIRT